MKLEFNINEQGRLLKQPEIGDTKIIRKFLILPKIYKTRTCKILYWLNTVYEEYEYKEAEWELTPFCSWNIVNSRGWQFKQLSTKKDYLRYKDREFLMKIR